MKIMVVETNLTVAHDLLQLFPGHRYEIELVVDTQASLQKSVSCEYDLIVIDISSLGSDGVSLCQQLREKGCLTPILLLIAPEEIPQMHSAIDAGADDYVIKPFTREHLLARVEFLLHRISRDIKKRKQADWQLEEMSTALGHAVEGISRLDPQGHYLFVNEAYAHMVGYLPVELVGRDWQKTVHPDDLRAMTAAYQQMLRDGKVQVEARGVRKDGSVFDKRLTMVSAYDEFQKFVGHYCFMKDVSDRKQTEIKLQRQLDRERLIAEITDSIRQTLDLDQILRAAVDQVRHLLQTDRVVIFRFQSHWQGIVEAESVASGWSNILSMKIRDSCLGDVYVGDYRQGRISAISNIDKVEIDPYHKDLLKSLEVQANLVVPILQGENLWGLLIAHHCSAPRQWSSENTQLLQQVAIQVGLAIQQAELYQKTREQAALIDISTDAIFVRDLEGRIVFWSRGAEQLYGWHADEAIGEIAHQLLKKRDKAELAVALKTTIEKGFWQGEITQATKSGRKILVASRWTLVRDSSGGPQSLLEVNTDITDKKRLEAQFYQAQRLESLGQLAGGIAHDLGNVLTPILGIAQMLRISHKDASAATQEQLKILEKSAKRGANMVKQILTFAQGSPGNVTTVDVVALLQEVINVVRQGFPNSIEIRQDMSQMEKSDQLLREVLVDSTQLYQVFMNLCINARDAMPEGGVLTISVNNCFIDDVTARKNLNASVGHYVVVRVADTGTGIAPEVRDRIFDPFFTTKAPDKGTGLGLATVSGIVKKANGFLNVSSEVGQGTQMEVYLPALE